MDWGFLRQGHMNLLSATKPLKLKLSKPPALNSITDYRAVQLESPNFTTSVYIYYFSVRVSSAVTRW